MSYLNWGPEKREINERKRRHAILLHQKFQPLMCYVDGEYVVYMNIKYTYVMLSDFLKLVS